MSVKRLNHVFAGVFGKLPLRTVLIVPFVVQIVGTVGLVGYLSYKNGQQAVENLAEQLMEEVGDRVEQQLDRYLEAPPQVNQSILDAVELGILDLNDFETLGKYFWRQFQLHEFGYINFGNERGEFIGVGYLENQIEIAESRAPNLDKLYSYAPDEQGNRAYLNKIYDNENPNDAAWYSDAVAAGKPIWSPIYQWADFPDVLAISSSYPVYDRDRELIGVLGIDLILSQIDDFLATLNVTRSSQVFIIERSGNLVASSSQSPSYEIVEGQGRRLKATQSPDPLIQTTAQYLQEKWGSLKEIKTTQQFTFKSNQQWSFVRVIPFRDQYGLDWLIVVAVPESDFMAQIHAHTHTTILVCIAALIGSTVIGILTARWVTKPILRLNTIAKDIARGEWGKIVEINRSDTVGKLAESFNEMAAQLQQSFAELQALNQALVESDRKLNQILEAIPVGISVHDITGKIIYANHTSRQLLEIEVLPEAETEQLAESYRVYQTGTEQLYPVENMPVVRSLNGERARVEDMEIRLPDKTIPLAVYSTPLFDEAGDVVAAIAAFFDITTRKHTEQLLADYNRTLEAQVAERTAELARANKQLTLEIAERVLLEGKLYSSTQQVRTIFESIPDIVLLINEQNSIQIIPTKTLGWDACDTNLLNSIVEHFFQQENSEESWFAKVQQVLETQKSLNFDYSLHINNREIWFTACLSPLPDNSVVWVARDISDRKQAEAALRESKHFIEQITNHSPQLLYIFDPTTGSDLFINQQSIEILGYTPEEINQRGAQFFLDVLHPDDFPLLDRNLNHWQTAADGEILTTESRFRHKDGSWRWLLSREVVFARDENHQVIKVLGTSQDISDRKAAELALKQHQEILQTIFDNIPVMLCFYDADIEVQLINRAFEGTLGWSLAEIREINIMAQCYPDPDYRASVEEFMMRADGTWRDFQLRTRAGKVLETSWANIRLPDGSTVGIGQDISDRKQAEAALRRSEERWHLAIQGSNDGIWDHNLITNEHFLSQRCLEMLGYDYEEVRDFDRWVSYVHPDDLPLLQETFQRHLNRETSHYFFEYRMQCKDGSYKWLLARGQALWDEQGNPVRAVGSLTDITELKQAEAALQRAKDDAEAANRAKSKFLAKMSHELRTPLNAILGFAQLIANSPKLSPEHAERLGIIIRSGEHLLSLINDVLNMAKIEAKHTTFNPVNFDLYSLLRDVEGMFCQQVQAKGLQLQVDCASDVPQYVQTDEVKLRQVLLNLLSNAIKFTSDGGVTLTVNKKEKIENTDAKTKNKHPITLSFTVTDTGAGIAPEELDSIFEAFTQTQAGKQFPQGTGLGLSISRSFVQLMGGKLTVSSQVGNGSTFSFELPVGLVEATAIPTELPTHRVIALEPNQPQFCLLIADDNRDNRQLLVQLLSPLGFEVREASNGREAVEIWESFAPHLIWMDIQMPVMNGYEAAQRIRAMGSRGNVGTRGRGDAGTRRQEEISDSPFPIPKIIALTASISEPERDIALNAGCDDFIGKPFRESDIFEAMHQHLGVRYVYKQSTQSEATQTESVTLNREILAVLPTHWLAEFHQATTEGDFEWMLTLIEQIREQHGPIAQALASLTNQLQFEQLLALTETGTPT